MAVRDTTQELHHDGLDFRLDEWLGHICEKRFQVVLDERHDDEYSPPVSTSPSSFVPSMSAHQVIPSDLLVQGLPNDNLSNPHHILVLSAAHQRHHLSQTRYRKPILFLVQFQLFQRKDLLGLVAFSSKDDAIRSFFYVVETRVRVD
jgi:hypothetical protein